VLASFSILYKKKAAPSPPEQGEEFMQCRLRQSALLPFQMPRDMETVEAQAEDVGRDMIPYTDSAGRTWDFAYGLNWHGIIDDERPYRIPVVRRSLRPNLSKMYKNHTKRTLEIVRKTL
jgi:hypothetical protein